MFPDPKQFGGCPGSRSLISVGDGSLVSRLESQLRRALRAKPRGCSPGLVYIYFEPVRFGLVSSHKFRAYPGLSDSLRGRPRLRLGVHRGDGLCHPVWVRNPMLGVPPTLRLGRANRLNSHLLEGCKQIFEHSLPSESES